MASWVHFSLKASGRRRMRVGRTTLSAGATARSAASSTWWGGLRTSLVRFLSVVIFFFNMTGAHTAHAAGGLNFPLPDIEGPRRQALPRRQLSAACPIQASALAIQRV